jgi:hypothetical protein
MRGRLHLLLVLLPPPLRIGARIELGVAEELAVEAVEHPEATPHNLH